MSGYRLSPHLSFSSNPTAVAPYKHPKLYALSGKSSNTTCYIGAHGEAMGNRTFIVPDGVTVQFTQPHGYSMAMEMSYLRYNKPIQAHGAFGTVTYKAGEPCNNYFLTKWHGRHSGYASKDAWETAGEDYLGWQRLVTHKDNLTLAFPRHRAFQSVLTLQECIEIMMKKYTSLKTFWCLFCRYDGSSDWSWNAQYGCFTVKRDGKNYYLNQHDQMVEY